MNSPFEALMLLCFGLAWPFSIYKSWTTKQVGSKSLVFLLALLVGYISGIVHKLIYVRDSVIYLYALNGTMVAIDIVLYLRNRVYQLKVSLPQAKDDKS